MAEGAARLSMIPPPPELFVEAVTQVCLGEGGARGWSGGVAGMGGFIPAHHTFTHTRAHANIGTHHNTLR